MSEDLIRRSDAIEAYSDIYWIDDRLNLAFREELDKIDEKIRNIPIVEVVDRPQGEWIPCSERLPRGDVQVLVSVSVADAPWSIILMSASSVGEYYRRGHIDAWMPLPKPYGEREGE